MTSSKLWPCAALECASLATRTTLRVGGDARWLLEPSDPSEFRTGYLEARERGLEVRVLGGGANLIPMDGVHEVCVIATDRMRRVFRPSGDGPALDGTQGPESRVAPVERHKDPRLVAWCGASMPGLVRRAQELGWTGLEGLVGVPGSLGGGIAMNAGGTWGELWDVVSQVRVLEPDGELVDLERADCNPSYRNGDLGARLVVGAVLRLEADHKLAVAERTREHLQHKKRVQPVTEWSAGCAFKNPDPELSDGRSAGRLIDEVGGKGLTRGGAIVSPLHGNFIINQGTATATDVLGLIEDLKALVRDKTGIELVREVRVWESGQA